MKPYMYDAAGNQSLQVEFQVEIGTESSVIKVVPDREWMQDTERVYPIVEILKIRMFSQEEMYRRIRGTYMHMDLSW